MPFFVKSPKLMQCAATMWRLPKSLYWFLEKILSHQDLYVYAVACIKIITCIANVWGGHTLTEEKNRGGSRKQREEERERKKESKNRWVILTANDEPASRSADKERETEKNGGRAKQYTSEKIMRATLSCECDELSVACRNETRWNDEWERNCARVCLDHKPPE